MLEQLVEILDAGREHVPEAVHEGLEVRVCAVGSVLQHLVQRLDHLPDLGEVLGGHPLDRLLHALEHLVEHLLLQLLHQLVELLLRLRHHELVVLERLDPAAEVVGHPVQLFTALLGQLLDQLPLGPVRALGLLDTLLDPLTLGVDDLLELLLQVVHHAVEVVPRKLLLPEVLELPGELVQPWHLLRAPAVEPLQGAVQVAMRHQVVGDRLQDGVGVQREGLLRPVPLRVAVLHSLLGVSEITPCRQALCRGPSRPTRPASGGLPACR